MLHSNNIFEILSVDPVYHDGKITAISSTDLKESKFGTNVCSLKSVEKSFYH